MYTIPSYVEIIESKQGVIVKSNLYQNEVKLFDLAVQKEFQDLVRCGGCSKISSPLTQFLHEQKLLVNPRELNQSLEELRNLMNKSLLITIMPTEGCNFRCPYCYEDHSPISMTRKTLDHIQEYIRFQTSKFDHIHLAWFGGEPTLCRDSILETSHMVKDLQEKMSFNFTSNMTTNGYLLGVEHFKQYYHAGVTSFQITIDGWNHDMTRPHVSGKGTLHKIIENLIAISALSKEEYRYHVLIRHNILPGDEDYSWYDHLNRLFGGDERFSVLVRPVGDWGGDSVQSLNILSENEASKLVEKHLDYIKEIGLQSENGKRGLLSQVCYAAYPHSLVFRSDGRIEKCTVCLNHPKNLLGVVDPDKGIVLNDSINQLWTNISLKQECYQCSELLSCMNRQCPKSVIVDGKKNNRCSNVPSKVF